MQHQYKSHASHHPHKAARSSAPSIKRICKLDRDRVTERERESWTGKQEVHEERRRLNSITYPPNNGREGIIRHSDVLMSD